LTAQGPLKGGKTVKGTRKELFKHELGYTDASNPFGDNSLSEKFVWKKKNEYLDAAGLLVKSTADQQKERVASKIREIHYVKKRRDEREVERRLLEQQRLEHDKDMKDELFDEWLGTEERFHLNSTKERTLLRIKQGRERPIDLVAKALAIADGDEFEDMTILDHYPHMLFQTMDTDEMDDALTDIEAFIKTDVQHKKFWKAMAYVCQDAMDEKSRASSGKTTGIIGAGVAESVTGEIHELLSSKSAAELSNMKTEIQQTLQAGGEGMDTQFFDAVAAKIPLYIARAEIEQLHNKAKKRSDKWLETHAGDASGAGADNPKGDWDDIPEAPAEEREDLSPALEPLSVLDTEQPGKGGESFSPVLEPLANFDPEELLDPVEDERMLRQVRETLISAWVGPEAAAAASGGSSGVDRSKDDEMVRQERMKGMGKDEAGFNALGKGMGDEVHGEVELPTKHYEWEDKYKPRKPRFFNRVKTGYEWNKYNQTHYDHDNPPPKMVQGYKFNIFYPDLIDKTKAPSYYLEKGEDAETVTLRFHAGPPYEDVAFKIVNREWNLSHKFGFRVVFDRGVLQLYFNFKRWRYRR